MELPEKISKIYDLFKNYYTEERVDITFLDPYAYIIVHWPSVTVKNENDDSIEIYDLFGIEFQNNKNLKRLFMPYSWKGFPLRKNYQMNDERLNWNEL